MKKIFLILLLFSALSVAKAQILVKDSLGDFVWEYNDHKIDSLDDVVTFSEQMPEFIGGAEMMMKFLDANLSYPIEAKKSRIEGRVVLQFIVNRDGSLSNIDVLKPLSHGCTEEAIRLVNKMPKWESGRQNGNQVRVRYTLPIVFKLK